ncbi:MAG: hypothetical protein HQ509_10925 [Candidatus Marinimicrobia bacterium]|nr:hypothetical protein [Candidatus Neomarinimicrobiota bacterium]
MSTKHYRYYFFFMVSLLFTHTPDVLAGELPKPISSLDKGYIAPVYSPDGNHILLSRVGYNTVSIFNINTEEIGIISEKPGSGFGYTWNYNSTQVAYKFQEVESRNHILNLYDLKDQSTKILLKKIKIPGRLSFSSKNEVIHNDGFGDLTIVDLRNDQRTEEYIYTVNKNIIEKMNLLDNSTSTVYTSEKELLNLVVSPNEQFLAFEEYGGDLFIFDIILKNILSLNSGNRPQFSPDNKNIVYMITIDDGHQLISSDIYMADIQGKHIQNLTEDFSDLALRPNWHPDGKSIVFDTDGFGPIYILKIE